MGGGSTMHQDDYNVNGILKHIELMQQINRTGDDTSITSQSNDINENREVSCNSTQKKDVICI